jgi:hypothetical protein
MNQVSTPCLSEQIWAWCLMRIMCYLSLLSICCGYPCGFYCNPCSNAWGSTCCCQYICSLFVYSCSVLLLEYSVFILTDSRNLSFPLFYRSYWLKKLEELEAACSANICHIFVPICILVCYLSDFDYGKFVIYYCHTGWFELCPDCNECVNFGYVLWKLLWSGLYLLRGCWDEENVSWAVRAPRPKQYWAWME